MAKTIFDIDNTQRICDSSQVRIVCNSPSDPTWANYRKLLGIKSHSRKLTLRESFLLWVLSHLYQTGKRKITKFQVVQSANLLLLENSEAIGVIRILSGAEGIEGRDLAMAISAAIGKQISTRTLYRRGKRKNLPRFSLNRKYTAEQVRRYMATV